MTRKRCTCDFKDHAQLKSIMRNLREGLITVHGAASALNSDATKIDFHFRYHEKQFTSRHLEKIIMKVKSDLLDMYDSLQGSFESLKESNEVGDIRLKMDLSKEVRALKKDLNEFIRMHSERIARDHQDLQGQWKKMQEVVLHDACDTCKDRLFVALTDVTV